MRSQNIALLVFKTLFIDTIKDLIRFPFWWYTKGLARTWTSFIFSVRNAAMRLGVLVWIKNIARPMFGQYDVWGRIISVLIRIIQIIFRSIILVLWVMVLLLKIIIWIALPVVIVSQIFYQITGGFFQTL